MKPQSLLLSGLAACVLAGSCAWIGRRTSSMPDETAPKPVVLTAKYEDDLDRIRRETERLNRLYLARENVTSFQTEGEIRSGQDTTGKDKSGRRTVSEMGALVDGKSTNTVVDTGWEGSPSEQDEWNGGNRSQPKRPLPHSHALKTTSNVRFRSGPKVLPPSPPTESHDAEPAQKVEAGEDQLSQFPDVLPDDQGQTDAGNSATRGNPTPAALETAWTASDPPEAMAARLVVTLRDKEGRKLAGMPVRLALPSERGVADSLSRVTDAGGKVAFRILWAGKAAHSVTVSSGKVTVNTREPDGIVISSR